MRAVRCKEYGPPQSLVIEDIASPAPGPHQVLLRVQAAGVNFPDTLIIENKYQLKPPLPFTPGSECAGVITALGPGVTEFQVGQAVMAFTGWGAFAEELAVDTGRLLPVPPELPLDIAASFVMTYGTSYHALVGRAALSAGETLLVLGAAGGVGLAAVEIGKAMGARVIAAASSADKLSVCRAHGADELIDYSTEDVRARIKFLTEGRGVDVVYDPVGGAHSEMTLRSTAWRGRFLVVGFASGEIPRIPLNLALLKGCSIMGVFWGEFTRREPAKSQDDLHQLIRLLQRGALKPLVSATYRLDQVAQALQAIIERRVTGKIVVHP